MAPYWLRTNAAHMGCAGDTQVPADHHNSWFCPVFFIYCSWKINCKSPFYIFLRLERSIIFKWNLLFSTIMRKKTSKLGRPFMFTLFSLLFEDVDAGSVSASFVFTPKLHHHPPPPFFFGLCSKQDKHAILHGIAALCQNRVWKPSCEKWLPLVAKIEMRLFGENDWMLLHTLTLLL